MYFMETRRRRLAHDVTTATESVPRISDYEVIASNISPANPI